ncbi:MAG: L,D-transpeptidase family protein [Ruminococcus sp.]|nr:L,D-transpeptidase family protein [Ruminococcus sp.]
MATATKKKRKKKKQNVLPVVIIASVLVLLLVSILVIYFVGRSRYQGKFLPNTYINGTDVSGKTLQEVETIFVHDDGGQAFTVIKRDGSEVKIPFSSIGFVYDTKQQIDDLFEKQDANAWFTGYMGKAELSFNENSSYDKDLLKAALKSADWGSVKNQDAKIELGDEGYYITEPVQGDEMSYDLLESYLLGQFANGNYKVNAVDSGCYIKPKVQPEDLQKQCDDLNKIWNLKIVYDFDYTTETLTGEELQAMISLPDEKGVIKVDRDKCMKYVEKLAKKYDTFDTKRKFKSTLQGNIIVPRSDDAKYGWWIWQDETCDALVEMLKEGKSVDKVKPIYYNEYGFEYSGVPEARTAKDDIGKTYCEVDLSAQHFWYYEKGKLKYDCPIVSGQTTSMARTTLPGVYKLWNKQTNYRMKDTNADGESWDTTCNYWNNISLCGIGMHDTVRRPAFGGNIYKYDGSHGCINMPLDAAKYVFDNVELGTPVVMYYQTDDSDDSKKDQ